MIALQPGYNPIRWTGPASPIADLTWLPYLVRAYAHNQVTGAGYVGWNRENQYPTLKVFMPGVDYLLYVTTAYELPDAVIWPGAFLAFYDYVPPTGAVPAGNIPAGTTPGTIMQGQAAQPILGGRLVGLSDDGLVPFGADLPGHRHRLLGIALNSAQKGGVVKVQRGGYVLYPGLSLVPDAVLLAGSNGRLAYSSEGMVFHQVVGKALTTDALILNPQTTYQL